MRSVRAPSNELSAGDDVEARSRRSEVVGERVDEVGLDRVLDDRVAVVAMALERARRPSRPRARDQGTGDLGSLGMAVYALGDVASRRSIPTPSCIPTPR